MRCLLTASLVVAGLAGNALGHRNKNNTPVRRRKTLGFGPDHPHAVFHSSPYQIQTNGFVPMSADVDPFEVADRFVKDILGTKLTQSMSYKIRKDSYTDSNTGVTHVYVRQVVNGLEVADGDMNINIKDGMVLSYGSSFYDGVLPHQVGNVDISLMSDPHRDYCEVLRRASTSSRSYGNQVTFNDPHVAEVGELSHLHTSNCRFQNLPYKLPSAFQSGDDMADFRPALLQFMVAATPKDEVVEDILGNFDKHMNEMSIEAPTGHFAPTDEPAELLVSNVPDAVNPVKARLAYIQVPSKKDGATHLTVVWKFEVEMQDNWYEAAVSATAPHRIISVVDWASDAPLPTDPETQEPATYNVFAWGINDPAEGSRSVNKENFDSLASPVGWHAIPYVNDPSLKGVRWNKKKGFWRNTTTTWGNNVFAQENWEGQNAYIDNYRPDAGQAKVFDYKYKPKVTDNTDAQAEAEKYINATVTQLFYTTNMVHDLYYRYGFDEVSGNFQQYNFGRGGAENDAVIANAQDGSGYNNANFMTPPDGQNGRMRMYLWNTAIPYRDGDFEAGIVIHELSHGLSTRLTGGPANSGCLGWGESGGMGEGWGDFLATTIRSTSNYSDYAMGAWAANQGRGIRNYIYSLNETVNPSTYKTLDKPGYWGVHAIGEVWAEILWVVSQGLIKKHGYSDDLFPPKPEADGTIPTGDFYRPSAGKKPLIPKHGNSLSVQLVLNGMKLQSCRPSFFDARDAIIQADQILTGGENFCTLWEGFSSRGLGPDAKVEGRTPWGGGIRTNSSTMSSSESNASAASEMQLPKSVLVAAEMKKAMLAAFEQLGIPEGAERLSLLSEASAQLVAELSLETLAVSRNEETSTSVTADTAHTTASAVNHLEDTPVPNVTCTSGGSFANAVKPSSAESRRSARITAVYEANADASSTIVVTPSATGLGTHCRWNDPGDPVNRVLFGSHTPAGPPVAEPFRPVDNMAAPGANPFENTAPDATSASDDCFPATPAELRRRPSRIIAGSNANADEEATIVVTPSATGLGAHRRWIYSDDPVDRTPSTPAAEGATLVPDEECATKGIGKEPDPAPSDTKSPKRNHIIIIPAATKRLRQDDLAGEAGPSRRTRSRPSASASTNSFIRNGVRYHLSRRCGSKEHASPSPLPSVPGPAREAPPFNHFPKLPRSRPQGLRREPAFYHKSHYEVAWVPEFGDYNSPPQTSDEAMPERMDRVPMSFMAPNTVPGPQPQQVPAPAPAPQQGPDAQGDPTPFYVLEEAYSRGGWREGRGQTGEAPSNFPTSCRSAQCTPREL
ncbi:hypothetical protein D9615_008220 [Tricholomella constricta]|uniref:FTP domain-containing protein n=1 Tax=Tricholomella constricta TaxID=117010 RepID=A0A8H5H3A9_9AGAR|nr:hypothetical protein D9615_008220 [Tricholomella constricta]